MNSLVWMKNNDGYFLHANYILRSQNGTAKKRDNLYAKEMKTRRTYVVTHTIIIDDDTVQIQTIL